MCGSQERRKRLFIEIILSFWAAIALWFLLATAGWWIFNSTLILNALPQLRNIYLNSLVFWYLATVWKTIIYSYGLHQVTRAHVKAGTFLIVVAEWNRIFFRLTFERVNKKLSLIIFVCENAETTRVADGFAFRVYAQIIKYKFFGQFHEKLYLPPAAKPFVFFCLEQYDRKSFQHTIFPNDS